MAFDKFEWIQIVVGDRRLTVADRFVLTNAAIKYVRHGNNLLRVRQTTIADQFAVGVRTVRQSISRGRDLGYLTLAQPRQRGRSHHGADEYRLAIPANAAPIPRNSGTELLEYRQEMTQIAAQANALTSENADLKGSLKGFIKGIEQPPYPGCSPRCRICRDRGIVLNADGKPGLHTRICHHDNTWHIATPEELEELTKGISA